MADKDPDCPFCAVIDGSVDADVVYRDETVVAFLDRRPLFPGHMLVSPAEHVEVLGDMTAQQIADVGRVTQAAARAMESALGSEGSFVAQNNRVGQSIPHVHVHVVPRRYRDGLKGFFWPRRGYEYPEQREEIAEKLEQGILAELER